MPLLFFHATPFGHDGPPYGKFLGTTLSHFEHDVKSRETQIDLIYSVDICDIIITVIGVCHE